MKRLYYPLLALFLSACAGSEVYYHKTVKHWEEQQPTTSEEPLYSLYLIGDVGDDTTGSNPVLRGLKAKLDAHDPQDAGVVFLGDNIYPAGLHKKSHESRAEDELRINVQLDAVKDFEGRVVFIPGNHDWNHYSEGGQKQLRRQEKYIQKYLDRGNTFRPSKGCPGPDVVELAPGLILVLLDTQWWLHPFERASGEKDGCDVRTPQELIAQFKDVLKKYRDQNVIVAGHHPLVSNGNHGGHFTLKDHLFPLTAVSSGAYIPMPVIGSLYPLYRRFLGHRQDIAHPIYRDMQRQLMAAMNEYENVIYAAGHEHNLQYALDVTTHYIVSGSGSKTTHVQHGSDISFGAEQRGYARVRYYANGEVWTDFFSQEDNGEVQSFRHKLFQREVYRNEPTVQKVKPSYAGKMAMVTPAEEYAAGALKRVFFGDLNRELWTTPLQVPYLDIHKEHGGLTPIKKGGGAQTLSLRVEDPDGRQYSLRGIRKNATYLTSKNLRGTIAQDLVYDGIAASHPYASVAIPPLAKEAGVYYPNPKLVYVPKDSVLGDYLEEFGGMFCLFEERPKGDMTGYPGFGNSKRVISYSDAVQEMHSSPNNLPDLDYILNARLFDMAIGDWDRHDDQWRWGTFEEGDKTYYRPIPRDRDQAFFEFDGILMWLAHRKWLVRKLQPFNEDVRDIAGLSFNARYFDRAFLVEASREDWIKHAKALRVKLTDEAIENAIRALPQEGFDITGEEIIATLKARRENLPEFAERYYEVLARNVDITGTLEDDYFEVIRLPKGAVEVNIYPRKKGKKVEEERYYHRVFHRKETKEIRLYGLDGKDEYQLDGDAKKSIVVRIVAGFEKDRFEDDSRVRGLKKHTKIYDAEGKAEIEKGREASVKVMPEEKAYDYDRLSFVYNKLIPLASIGFNVNDGFYIGPGFKFIAQGFKKSPYKYYHRLLANRAFGSNGYNVDYEFDYIDLFGKVDFSGSLTLNRPLVYQYYGSGNNVEPIAEDREFYNVRVNDFRVSPRLKWMSKSQSQQLTLGPDFQYVDFERGPVVAVQNWEIDEQRFGGATLGYQFINQDDLINPSRGVQFHLAGAWKRSLESERVQFLNLKSELRLYFPLRITRKQTTLALRSGVQTNVGDYAFFQSNFLSGVENFRGVQRNRFAGRTANYNNIDVRASLFKVPNYIAPFDVGILGHFDVARVWENNETSEQWHRSYGGGLFLNVLDYLTLLATYSYAEDSDLLLAGTKFLF